MRQDPRTRRFETVLLAGLTRYDTQRDPLYPRYVDEVLPADPGIAHAVTRFPYREYRGRPRQPEFLTSLTYERALCGATVKVVLPIEFDESDPDGCQACVVHAHNGTSVRPRPAWYDQDDSPPFHPDDLIDVEEELEDGEVS